MYEEPPVTRRVARFRAGRRSCALRAITMAASLVPAIALAQPEAEPAPPPPAIPSTEAPLATELPPGTALPRNGVAADAAAHGR